MLKKIATACTRDVIMYYIFSLYRIVSDFVETLDLEVDFHLHKGNLSHDQKSALE